MATGLDVSRPTDWAELIRIACDQRDQWTRAAFELAQRYGWQAFGSNQNPSGPLEFFGDMNGEPVWERIPADRKRLLTWIGAALNDQIPKGREVVNADIELMAAAVLDTLIEKGVVEDVFVETRCPSCQHSFKEWHRDDGCWHTVSKGTPGDALGCPCSVGKPTCPYCESQDVAVAGFDAYTSAGDPLDLPRWRCRNCQKEWNW